MLICQWQVVGSDGQCVLCLYVLLSEMFWLTIHWVYRVCMCCEVRYSDRRYVLCRFTERIACINFQLLGAFSANIRINAIYNICNISKYNFYKDILLKMQQLPSCIWHWNCDIKVRRLKNMQPTVFCFYYTIGHYMLLP